MTKKLYHEFNEHAAACAASKPKRLVSFSGGRSSAYMAYRLKQDYSDKFHLKFLFANTGQENEATLDFVNKCDKEFGLGVVWLEAVVHHGEKRGCTHKVVTYETASRKGEPFEAMISKYGIPNKSYPHCTRELKLNPMRSYLWSKGWEVSDYLSFVGVRADEPDRLRSKPQQGYAMAEYPLAKWFPMTKPEVNEWWRQQPFDLDLKDYQGNCKWCWKKSFRKLAQIAHETPEAFDFPERMERDYGLAGHNVDGTKRVFFRGNQCVADIRAMGARPDVERDDPDADSGCSESCEAVPYADTNPVDG